MLCCSDMLYCDLLCDVLKLCGANMLLYVLCMRCLVCAHLWYLCCVVSMIAVMCCRLCYLRYCDDVLVCELALCMWEAHCV